MSDLASVPNLGPASLKMLADVGVTSREQLSVLGGPAAYHLLRRRGHKVSMNMVYAIEAGLLGMPWTHLPPELREDLKRRVAEAEDSL